MELIETTKKVIKGLLTPFGYRIVPLKKLITLQAALQRHVMRHITINTVIDVGASNGQWTDVVIPYCPDALYYLIEANPFHLASLQIHKKNHKKVDFVLAAAGDAVGEISFEGKMPEAGLAYHGKHHEGDLRVPMTTIDHEVTVKNLKPPFLLKLDTHGFEVAIFNGAVETLKETNLIIVEVYNFRLTDDSLLFSEMIDFLDARGFRPVDLCDPSFRPDDQAFWQMDLFFIRSDRQEFKRNTYLID
jgi:FkbM family methyltransferase